MAPEPFAVAEAPEPPAPDVLAAITSVFVKYPNIPLYPAVVEFPAGIISDSLKVLFPVKSITLPVAPEVAPVTNSSTTNAVPFQELTTIDVAWSTTDVVAKSPFANLG